MTNSLVALPIIAISLLSFGCVPADVPASIANSWPVYELIACPTEDSDNCYWDASEMGNGTGDDFITLGGVTYYHS